MCEGLGNGHLAPEWFTLSMERQDAPLGVLYKSGVKEIFRVGHLSSLMSFREGKGLGYLEALSWSMKEMTEGADQLAAPVCLEIRVPSFA